MNGTTQAVWDGTRPRLRRDVVQRRQMQAAGLGIVSATENLTAPTDWAFEEDHHSIVVHLGGRLDRLECHFSDGPSGVAIPARGDIWVVPAGCRYAALAEGDHARFVELHVPPAMLRDARVTARVRQRDDFLFAAADRLSNLMADAPDPLNDLAAHAIADAIRHHLILRYRRGAMPRRPARLSEADRARLADAVRTQPDAPHSLASLAALVDMDVRRFTSAFQAGFGISPWQYVLRARLDEAARQLAGTGAAVTEIALATGFATPSHFATAFVRRFGVPPSRYRALIGVQSTPTP